MRLGYLYSRYPVLSQTFCDAEMLELERRGHEIVLASLYPPKTPLRHEYLAKLQAPIRYAPSSHDLDKQARKAKRLGLWPYALVQKHEEKDRKSTRLNSSHVEISYAVFCLKKKKKKI